LVAAVFKSNAQSRIFAPAAAGRQTAIGGRPPIRRRIMGRIKRALQAVLAAALIRDRLK